MSIKSEWYGDQLVQRSERAVKDALRRGSEMVLTKSKEKVPVLTGALLRSGTRDDQDGGYTQELSYNTPYAHRQHEGVHFDRPHGGEAKFLETPVRQYGDAVHRMVKDAWAGALR